ncbi:MAG TPA: sialidase family protein [Candidatus Dormibacteraeota bacterium]
MNWDHLTKIQKKLASGALEMALAPDTTGLAPSPGQIDPGSDLNADAQDNLADPGGYTAAPSGSTSSNGSNYIPAGSDQCKERLGDNVKVNQNCVNVTDSSLQGRGQAQNETSIAIDPMNSNHIIASQNDYRRGDGNCYGGYSLDAGRTWNDTTIPMSFTRGTFLHEPREYWQAGGDTSVAWDTKGNAYFSCQMFNRGEGVSANRDQSSAFYVFRSTGNFGASWNFPGRPVTEFNDVVGAGNVLEDKQLLTVDNHVGSPFQDRVYVSWTEFAADGSAYIWESYSNDYGQHFSPRHLVSANTSLCTVTYGAGTPQGNCNENQFSQPFTGSDGALYVVFNNFNNAVQAGDNRNQILLAKSIDGGNTFSPPIKVSDYYDLPDCPTYQGGKDFGRACVPEKGASTDSFFRATNYASGKVNPTNPAQVVVTFGSYINEHSNEANGCVPTGLNPATGNNLYTGVKTPGACNNDILISTSADGGFTFTGTATDPRAEPVVTTDPGQATTDQWWQWEDFTKDGKLAVSYYDREYGSDETTGYSDVSMSSSGSLAKFTVKRVTSASMPPPTAFGGLFFGDYTGLAASTDAHPVWMDTRDPELFVCPGTGTPGNPPQLCTANGLAGFSANIVANDENIYTASEGVSSS